MAALNTFSKILLRTRAMGCRAMSTGGDIEVPRNIAEISDSERAQFSKNRMRDLGSRRSELENRWIEEDPTTEAVEKADKQHIQSYDSKGSVSLKSVMQTNVPDPYTTAGAKAVPTNLNMPGGHINQSYKYEALERQDAHPSRLGGSSRTIPKGRTRVACLLHGLILPLSYQRTAASCCGTFVQKFHTNASSSEKSFPAKHVSPEKIFHTKPSPSGGKTPHGHFSLTRSILSRNWIQGQASYHTMLMPMGIFRGMQKSGMSVRSESGTPQEEKKLLTSGQKLKQAVRDYGSTVVVFHVAISLASLGFFYVVVSSGVDMVSILQRVGIGDSIGAVAGASTFVVAYAVHKVFAPARIACTLTVAPLIVRHLRRKGLLKPPKTK